MSKEDLKKAVPLEFYKGELYDAPAAYNVGELIGLLEKLPKDLKIEHSFSKGIQVIVYNISCHNPHLGFQENEL